MFGIPGNVGQIAEESVARIIARQQLEQQLAQRARMDEAQLELDRQRVAETVRRNQVDEARVHRGDQLAAADATVSGLDALFDPESAVDVDVSKAQRDVLSGTPQAARVRQVMNLTARPTDPAMAGTMSQTPTVTAHRLTPTAPQQQARRQVVQLTRRADNFNRLRNDPNTPEKVRTLMDLEQAGMNAAPIGPSLLETPADRQAEDDRAFGNFERRQGVMDTLIRGRQPARPDPARAREQTRREALRAARQGAIAEYNARKDRDTGLSSIDLDELIQQYEDDYLGVLDALDAQETSGVGAPADAGPVTPGAGRPAPAPPGSPRVVTGLSRIPPPGSRPAGRGGGQQPTGATGPTGPTGPRAGEQRLIDGRLAEWDGRGWLPVPQ